MKLLTGFLRISVLSLIMVLSAGPVDAQNVRTSPTTTESGAVRTNHTDSDDHNDWGWIGLLGLLGLAGLLPKKRVVDHDRGDTGNRTVNR